MVLVTALLCQRGSALKENQTQLQTLKIKMHAISPKYLTTILHIYPRGIFIVYKTETWEVILFEEIE